MYTSQNKLGTIHNKKTMCCSTHEHDNLHSLEKNPMFPIFFWVVNLFVNSLQDTIYKRNFRVETGFIKGLVIDYSSAAIFFNPRHFFNWWKSSCSTETITVNKEVPLPTVIQINNMFHIKQPRRWAFQGSNICHHIIPTSHEVLFGTVASFVDNCSPLVFPQQLV